MDRELTGDQNVLLDATRRFLDEQYPLSRVREQAYQRVEVATDYQRRSAELGWYSLLVPADLGGGSVSGNGLLDAVLVAYLRGAALQPSGFIGTNVVASALGGTASGARHEAVLRSLVDGESSAAWAHALDAPPSRSPGIVASTTGSGYCLVGSATLVEGATSAGWFLVTASAELGTTQFLVPADTAGLVVRSLRSLDLTRSYGELRFEQVTVGADAVVGAPGEADHAVADQLAVACALTAAESVGAMHRDFENALQYAKDRIAFGRPIGSFQAIKHLLADTSLALEMSKAITLAAATTMGTVGDAYGREAASMAKAFVGDAGVELAQNCFQVFGGIGYTWEHDQHLYLRRLTTDAALFGNSAWHRERLCQLSGI